MYWVHVECPSPLHCHKRSLFPKRSPVAASPSTKNSGGWGQFPQPPDLPIGPEAGQPFRRGFRLPPCNAFANEHSFGESKMRPAPPVNTPTGCDCLAATSLGSAHSFRYEFPRLLIRPHSQTPGFQSPARPKAGTGNQPGTKSPSCISHTHHRSIHVTSEV